MTSARQRWRIQRSNVPFVEGVPYVQAFIGRGHCIDPGSYIRRQSPANVITCVTIQDVSSQLTQNFTRAASFTVTAPGLNINGPGTYSDVPDGNMWLNTGNGCCGGFSSSDPTNNTDAHPQITWNLGGVYDVNSMRIWNYNENSGNPAEFTLRRNLYGRCLHLDRDGNRLTRSWNRLR